MTGHDLKATRLKEGLTQEQAAGSLGVTQAYLSMVEREHRRVSPQLLAKVQQVLEVPPTELPLEPKQSNPMESEQLKLELGALGYPGFSYLRGKPKQNPALLLLEALGQPDLDTRVVEAFPWLVLKYAHMDWNWLIMQAKQHDRQNRLGYVVTLAKELATKRHDDALAEKLAGTQATLERSRLAREDTLCHDFMTNTERAWLRQNRPKQAEYWNLLTDVKLDHLDYAAA